MWGDKNIFMTGTGDVPCQGSLKMIVFDLDGTLWWPEMYMLWGSNGGSPFTPILESGDVKDLKGESVKLMADSRAILADIIDCRSTIIALEGVKVAISSRTDEPEWAQECMEKMIIKPGHSMKSVFHFEEISKVNKVRTFAFDEVEKRVW